MASCSQIKEHIVPYLDGELSDADRLIVDQHVAHCAHCREALEATRTTVATLFETLAPQRLSQDLSYQIMAHLPEMDTLYGEGHELTERAKHPERSSRLAQLMTWVPVAVPVMLLMMGLLLWTGWPAPENTQDNRVGMVLHETGLVNKNNDELPAAQPVHLKDTVVAESRYETGPDSELIVGLNGPSQVRVFANTRVKFTHAREMRVESGEAYFEVGHASRYFRVQTPDGFVTVFGTSFGVNVRPEGTRVTVVSGEVQVENAQAFAVLHAGERTDVRPVDRLLSVSPAPEAEALQARAHLLQPDNVAEKLFLASLSNSARLVLRAEQVFVVETHKHIINAIHFEWKPDPFSGEHAGYDVYVSDNNLKPLFKEHINAALFADKSVRDFTVAVPKHVTMNDTAVLHISVLPDYTTGSIETTFAEVSATAQ